MPEFRDLFDFWNRIKKLTEKVDNLSLTPQTNINYFQNPICEVKQRRGNWFTTSVTTTNGEYTIDRFRTYSTTSNQTITVPSTDQPPGIPGRCYKMVNTDSGTIAKSMGVRQYKNDLIDLAKKNGTMTFSAYIKSNNGNARLMIYDGSSWSSSTAHTGGGSYELLSVTADLSSATGLQLFIGIMSATGTNVNITNADYYQCTGMIFNVGNTRIEIDYPDVLNEMWECMKYGHIHEAATNYNFIVSWAYYHTAGGYYAIGAHIVYPRKMVQIPSITTGGGNSDWSVTSNLNVTVYQVTTGAYPNFSRITNTNCNSSYQIQSPNSMTTGDLLRVRLHSPNAWIFFDAEYYS